MNNHLYISHVIATLLCYFISGVAIANVDTLRTTNGDEIRIKYEVINSDGGTCEVRFLNVLTDLTNANRKKYDIDKVSVMFFDVKKRYRVNIEESYVNIDVFKIPENVDYDTSQDGYFEIHQDPKLTFRKVEKPCNLRIPIYLAYKNKKDKVTVFAQAKKDLVIKLGGNRISTDEEAEWNLIETEEEEIIDVAEIEDVLDDPSTELAARLMELIDEVNVKIDKMRSPKDIEKVEKLINMLENRKFDIVDENLLAEIDNVSMLFEDKKEQIEQREIEKLKVIERMNTACSRLENEYQKFLDDEKKNEQRLMVIGGVVVAVLAFFGNMGLQRCLNRRRELKWERMAKKAEEDAMRQAESATRGQMNRLANKGRTAVRNGVRKATTVKINGKPRSVRL